MPQMLEARENSSEAVTPATRSGRPTARSHGSPAGKTHRCRLCGESQTDLRHHLRWAHEVTLREYQEQFGLPARLAA